MTWMIRTFLPLGLVLMIEMSQVLEVEWSD